MHTRKLTILAGLTLELGLAILGTAALSGQNTASSAILSLHKSDGVSTVRAGERLTYTLTYTNSDSEDAAGVVITDTLPNYVEYIGCAECEPPGESDPEAVIFYLPTITQTSGQVQLFVQVEDPLPAGADAVINTARMTHQSLPSPIIVSDVDAIDTRPDLTISANHSPSLFSPGKVMTYTVTYGNAMGSHMHAEGVKITTTLPSGTEYVGDGWDSSDGQNYTYPVGELLAGYTGHTITFAVRHTDTPEISQPEFLTPFAITRDGGITGDANADDNTAYVYVGVPDLVVTDFIVEPIDPLPPDVPVTFTIVLKNQGTGWAWNPDNYGGFYVDIFIQPIDSYPFERNGDIYTVTLPTAPGAERTIVLTHDGFSEEQIREQIQAFYVKVDNYADPVFDDGQMVGWTRLWGLVPEYNEMNNVRARYAVPPQARFIATPTSGRAPLSVDFIDQSTGNVTSWSWDFGDGVTGTLQNPTHTYIAPGTYTTTLMVGGPGGTDTLTRPDYITVYDKTEPGDAYEPDDICAHASPIATGAPVQVHTFHDRADADWVTFDAVAGTTYLIQALVPASSPADVALEIYDQCAGPLQDGQDHTFSPGVRLEFQPAADGPLYLKLLNHDPAVFGSEVAYHLSVRALADDPTPGAVVIVAGKLRDGDRLQPNIHHVTNAVYRLFRAHGYDGDRIHYLATDATLDPDDNGTPDVDGLPTRANLQQAITGWAAGKVGPERAFTLYLMDHGDYDLFYLNGPTQTVDPNDIDGWLDTLKGAAPGVRVNVIVEACHSGSFIDSTSASELIQTVSGPSRVVIASTGAHALAYATDDGAVFSDPFLQALGSGTSLYNSFQEARWAAQEAHPDQTPWLDDDGDGRPNEGEDGQEAARRGFAYAGTLGESWPPYVVNAGVGEIQAATGIITAEVRDDGDVSRVWAAIYPPSYRPPTSGEELVQETVPTVTLSYVGDEFYRSEYDGFAETGPYRVVVYAVDEEGLAGRPKAVGAQHRTYLPLVVNDYAARVTLPVHVGDAIPVRAVAYQGEVFSTTLVQMPEALPSGGRFYFSSRRDAIAEVLVDDELGVLLDGTEAFTHRFSGASTLPEPAVVEVPRAVMEGLVGRTPTVKYRDVYGEVVGASAMWLIWTP